MLGQNDFDSDEQIIIATDNDNITRNDSTPNVSHSNSMDSVKKRKKVRSKSVHNLLTKDNKRDWTHKQAREEEADMKKQMLDLMKMTQMDSHLANHPDIIKIKKRHTNDDSKDDYISDSDISTTHNNKYIKKHSHSNLNMNTHLMANISVSNLKYSESQELGRKLEIVTGKVNIITDELEAAKKDFANKALTKTIADLQSNLNDIHDSIEDATDEVKRNDIKLRELHNTVKSKDKKLKDLTDATKKQQKKLDECNQELLNAKNEIIELQKEKAKLQQQRIEQNSNINSNNNQNNGVMSVINDNNNNNINYDDNLPYIDNNNVKRKQQHVSYAQSFKSPTMRQPAPLSQYNQSRLSNGTPSIVNDNDLGYDTQRVHVAASNHSNPNTFFHSEGNYHTQQNNGNYVSPMNAMMFRNNYNNNNNNNNDNIADEYIDHAPPIPQNSSINYQRSLGHQNMLSRNSNDMYNNHAITPTNNGFQVIDTNNLQTSQQQRENKPLISDAAVKLVGGVSMFLGLVFILWKCM